MANCFEKLKRLTTTIRTQEYFLWNNLGNSNLIEKKGLYSRIGSKAAILKIVITFPSLKPDIGTPHELQRITMTYSSSTPQPGTEG